MSEAVAAPEAPAAAPSAPAATPAEAGATPAATPAESAPATPPGEKKPDTAPEQPEQKPGKSRFERKISRLYREAAEHKARADLLERQLNEVKPKAAADPAAPKLDQFNDIEEYAAAREKYAKEKALKEFETQQKSETQKQQQARLVEGWEEKASRAESKYEDFDEVVGELKPTSPWAMAIMQAENGEDIAYHLGKNLKEASRIAALDPVAQIREIGRLEAKLLAEPKKEKQPSKAPPPINPLQGGASAPGNPDEVDDKTWFERRLKSGARR